MSLAIRENPVVRKHLKNLCELLAYANSRNDGRWANQSTDHDRDGVFGNAFRAVKLIVAEVYGDDFADEAIDRIDFGSYGSFYHDLLAAIDQTLELRG